MKNNKYTLTGCPMLTTPTKGLLDYGDPFGLNGFWSLRLW